ncbi:hypothetical protein Dsin_005419 [Dipteronia sinensis]|uniref:DYW domain-containing protein n=1 Tax=Dipteronia sinensis TaxID=43782 RepID=A0AAE0AWU5_9ROSI|nr:hypothetical protein Dsin_005419 [Dipteronia sinensis]
MSLLSPSHTFLRHHQPPIIIHRNTSNSSTRHSLHAFFNAKSSLSLSTKTHQCLTNNSTYQLHFLPDITSLCESNDLTKAYLLLQENPYNAQIKEAIGVLLQACGRLKNIEIGKKVHEIVLASTQYSNDFVLNTRLITMYAMCGSPLDSRRVFDNLSEKNLFQWNAIISGYTRNELYSDALNIFVELIALTELKPDNFTFPCVIKACGGIGEVGLGYVVHGMAAKMGLIGDVFVGNALIALYGKCGLIEEMLKVFEVIRERNLVSWNSIICGFSENGFSRESFNFFLEMMSCDVGLIPDVATLVTLLPVCAAEGDVEMGRLVHGLAIKLGLNQELMVNNALVDMYSKCGYLSKAQILFDRNNNRNVVSWNTIVGAFSMAGDKCGSFDHLRKMQMELEMKANKVTVLNSLTICLGKSEFPSLKELHGYSLRHGFQNDELVANALVAAYAKCGSMASAEYVFDGMRSRTVSSWNAVIGGHAQNGDPSKALDFFHQMTCSCLEPDWFSISSLLLACSHLKSLQYGEEIHGFVLRYGLEKDPFVAISLLSLYMYCEKSFSARVLFDGMEDKSLVSWNAMITGYSQNRLPIDALTLFRQMVSNGIQPSEIAIMSVFGACSQLSALRLGKETHCYALKASLMDDVFIGCSIIDMYAKCGCIERSRWIFDKLTNKDVASWNAMIVGYGIHGHGKEAIKLFEKMQEQGQWPDGFTFVGILMACSHAGLVEDGLKYFNQMQNFHGLKPKLEHYSCVVDMLGRGGQLDDALRLIDEMPEEPDAGVWNSLLSSCRTYGALDMGEKVAKKLLELEPKKPENYVLLSNLFAGSAKWDDVRKVRQSMKENGLQKDAGRSWIELGVNVYSFVAGDDTLPESEDIREMWREIEEKISEIGYKPLTDSVLHEVEEEEKINLLRGHSEKLAISFGLLKTTKGVTLRVCKNLRICVDCHNAAKLISKVADRKIVVRDNKRFHHFRDGFCSCGDFW